MFFKISRYLRKYTCVGVSFLFKKRIWRRCFLVNLRNFSDHIFCRNLRTAASAIYVNTNNFPEVFCKGVFKNFAKFTGKYLGWSIFFNKVARSIIKETPTQVFSSEFCEIFKSTIFIEYLRWLLLMCGNISTK